MIQNLIINIEVDNIKVVYQFSKNKQIPLSNTFKNKNTDNVSATGQANYYFQRYTHKQFQQLVELIKPQLNADEYKQNHSNIEYNVLLSERSHKNLETFPKIKQSITTLTKKNKESIKKLSKNDYVWEIIQLCMINQQIYTFQKTFKLIELDQINSNNQITKNTIQSIPPKFMMAVIKRQLTLYEVNLDSKTSDYLMKSIIGQLTLQSIVKKLFPNGEVQQLINQAFKIGNFSNTDLLVEDIYGKNTQAVGLGGKIIASSLGKIFKNSESNTQILQDKKNDIVRSLTVSFAINNANLIALSLLKHNLQTVVVITEKFNHQCIQCLIQQILNAYAPGKNVYFCKNVQFNWLLQGMI